MYTAVSNIMKIKIKALLLLLFFSATFICGCSSNSGHADEDEQTSSPPGYALLGQVMGATVELFDSEYPKQPVCTTTTATESTAAEAGSFKFPVDCIQEDKLYLVVVSGGEEDNTQKTHTQKTEDQHADSQYDSNDDIEGPALLSPFGPKSIKGQYHGLITGERLLSSPWNVTVLSEALFQSVQALLQLERQGGSTMLSILSTLDKLAPRFLNEDINSDSIIDNEDVLSWHPQLNDQSVNHIEQIDSLREAIYAGENVTAKDVSLSKPLAGHLDTLSKTSRVIIKGDIAYVATDSTLLIVDIKDPTQAQLLGAFPSGWISDIAVIDKVVFIALAEQGIQMIDVSIPAQAYEVGTLTIAAHRLASAEGTLLFYNEEEQSLGLINASTLSTTTMVLSLKNATLTLFKIRNNIAYLVFSSIYTSSLVIIDFSDPNALQQLGEYQLRDLTVVLPNEVILDMTLFDNFAYLAVSNPFLAGPVSSRHKPAIIRLDISEPDVPVQLDRIEGLSPYALKFADNIVYAWEDNKLKLLDPYILEEFDSIELPQMLIKKAFTYDDLSDALNDFAINPLLLSERLNYAHQYANNISIQDNYAYICGGNQGLLIVELSTNAAR